MARELFRVSSLERWPVGKEKREVMDKPLVDRIPFAKILVVLTVVFGIALGLCGVTFVLALNASGGNSPAGLLLSIAAPVELVMMALSFVGMVVVAIFWVVLSVARGNKAEDSERQRLIDGKDDEDKLS
jgi:hypothetical protein